MKTRLPFSTISYNTRAFLEGKLNDLVRSRVLSEWYAIEHKGEDDEAGKKPHFHVLMIPARGIQTDDVRQELIEYDPQHPDQPRKCLFCKFSKFGHWYLYGLHDKAYLAAHQQSRRYHYRHEDFFGSDLDCFNARVREVDIVGELGAFKQMEAAIDQGFTFEQFFRQGRVPVSQVNAYEKAWQLMLATHTDRGGRPGHDIDHETGEVIEP